MKKIMALLLAFCLLFALAACGSSGGSGKPAEGQTAEKTEQATPAPEKEEDAPKANDSAFSGETVTIVVCRGAGGSADIVARMFAPYFAEQLGCNVIVENVEGGSGKIGLSQVYRAEPDGCTLVLGNFPSYILTEVIEGEDVEYEMRGFEPIAGISGKEGNALIVPADSPFETIEDLVAYGQEHPGELSMAVTSGISNSALAQAMFLDVSGMDVTIIPYDSGNNCVTAAMGKEVDCAICSSTATYTPASEGSIRVLTTFGEMEDEQLKDVPTFASIYGEEYAYDVVMGVLAPPETPEEILTALRTAADAAVNDPAFAEAAGASFNVVPRTSEELTAVIESCYSLAEASKEMF